MKIAFLFFWRQKNCSRPTTVPLLLSHSAARYIEAQAVSWDFLLLYPGVVFKVNHIGFFLYYVCEL